MITTEYLIPAPWRRYATAESVIDGAKMQPVIHDLTLTVQEHDRFHRYRVFFKRHKHLPFNKLFAPIGMRGDVLVMRLSDPHPGECLHEVQMRRRDGRIVDWVMRT